MNRKAIKIIVGTLFLMLPFQNCTPHRAAVQTDITSTLKSDLSSGGNGEYYGGKLGAGIYVRPLPELNCGQEKYLAKVEVTESGLASGRSVDATNCTVSEFKLTSDDLEFASYEPGRFGLNEGIYTLVSDSSSGSSGSGSKTLLVDEAWCRAEGSSTTTGFDIVIKADYKNGAYSSVVVAGSYANGRLIRKQYEAPTPRREIEAGRRVRYRGNGFELDIDTGTYNIATGKMEADFEFATDGHLVDRQIYCRLGGELDLENSRKPYSFALLLKFDTYKSLAQMFASYLQKL